MNGEYRDDSEIGKLMHDYSCWNPDDMYYELLRDTTRYYKENPKGVEIMCRAFEQTREEGRLEGRAEGREVERLENLRSIIAVSKVSEKEAMDLLRIPTAERERFSALLKS